MFVNAKTLCIAYFGETDFQSNPMPFTHTDYYQKEFGDGLQRVFISFKKLVSPNVLSKIKVSSNTIEKKLAQKDLRTVNIDPGYLALAKVVLASTKDFYHRIYLDKGIYAEITLLYQQKRFRPLEWTYPDYRSQRCQDL